MNNAIDTYRVFSDFYDLYVGRFNSDFDFYKAYSDKLDSILEIGCGTGRILNLLLQLDCKVTGVDISQEMLDKAIKRYTKQIQNGDLTIINHDFSVDKLNARFDKVLLTFYTFNYIIDKPIDFLTNVHDSINDDGLLLLDLFYPNSLLDNTINGKWVDKEFNINGQLIKIRDCRTVDNDIENRQQVFIVNGAETTIETRRKYFSPLRLKDILDKAGYKDIEFSYGYDYSGFSEMIDETKLKNNYIVKAIK